MSKGLIIALVILGYVLMWIVTGIILYRKGEDEYGAALLGFIWFGVLPVWSIIWLIKFLGDRIGNPTRKVKK